ncbi:MAG TPA: ferrochelatase [Verrucomicrobiota bacterium]|nr:ferrochelatase [Verrucomicrobiota bacterium]HNU51940.1 ferrochelatase [Verrucomicrobiota bacterium]
MSDRGVLLVNLGSPASPAPGDVRRFLREFLMDGRVLDLPWLVRLAVVELAILPRRTGASASAYREIWTPEGSPLVVSGGRLAAAVERGAGLPVELGMRYQEPSIGGAIGRLVGRGVRQVLVVPLFPHYAMSSYETAVERVREVALRRAPAIRFEFVPPYYDYPRYIEALVASAEEPMRAGFDHLLFSFHGLPERHLRRSDPTGSHCLRRADCCEVPSVAHGTCYRHQCLRTVRAFVAAAGVAEGKTSVAFQSRMGKDPWLQPSTECELERLARGGVRRLLVLCPAFVADCLETIEEIGVRGRERFLAAGGGEFIRVPCLNEHPLWIRAVVGMVERFMAGGRLQAAEVNSSS